MNNYGLDDDILLQRLLWEMGENPEHIAKLEEEMK